MVFSVKKVRIGLIASLETLRMGVKCFYTIKTDSYSRLDSKRNSIK
jgi:hypothetical protein